MSCFLVCFGGFKDDNRRKSDCKLPLENLNFEDHRREIVPDVNVADKEDHSEKRVDLVVDSWAKQPEVQPSLTEQAKPEELFSIGTQKKATFDSNIKEYNHVSVAEEPGNVQDNVIGVNQTSIKLGKSSPLSESNSTVSSLGLYPPNHRYQNCRESDDDEEELDDEVSDLDEDEEEDEYRRDDDDEDASYDEFYNEQEFSAMSSSSLESRTETRLTREVNDGHLDTLPNSLTPETKTTTPRVNHNVRDRAGYIHSVMNPVENTSQWRRVKTKGTSPLKEKENFRIFSSFEPKSKTEVAVDTSLSNWLVSAQKTPINKATISSGASMSSHGSNSVISQERPILGALTMEELKQHSASSTSRKSPSRSPYEKPLVGSVGVHWNDRTLTETPPLPLHFSKYSKVQM